MSDESRQSKASQVLMEGLMTEAVRVGDPRRIGTLERLKTACDDLLSGQAMELAKARGEDPEKFRITGKRGLTSVAVGEYVGLRYRMGNPYWTGPKAETVRGDPRLRDYVKNRSLEANIEASKPRKDSRARVLEEIVSSIKPLTDQSRIRATLEEGRRHKRELDLLRAALRKVPGIDEALMSGRRPADGAVSIHPPLGKDEREILRGLVTRLADNAYLSEAGLIFGKGRLKMEFAPGKDIVLPEEMRLLRVLAGFPD